MTNTKKKLVISMDIYVALCEYQHCVDRYTSLDNDNYDTEFSYALKDIEESEKQLNRLLRNAEKVA